MLWFIRTLLLSLLVGTLVDELPQPRSPRTTITTQGDTLTVPNG